MNLGFGGGGSEFQIPVLSAIVGMIADLMRIGLQICYEFTSGLGFPNYVIAIVVLTILIKTLLLPLAVKQIRSMKAMQAIQPEIQKIQKKYRNDPAMMRQEMGRLYKEHNASPMAGCLPLLIQMPFLIAMYYAIQGFNYDPLHAGFLWIESLAAEDGTYILPVPCFLADDTERCAGQPKDDAFHDASYDRLDVSSFSERFGDLLGGEQCLPVFPAAYHVPRGKGKGNDKRAFEKRRSHCPYR